MKHTQRLSPQNTSPRCRSALFIGTLIGLALSSVSADQRLAVTGDRVNLRAAPYATAEVVGQVSQTDTLILQGDIGDDWVQVTPPDTVDLWIYANLVKDSTVTVNNAQVRAGAGLNFNVVGQLQSGDAITKRGQVGDWIKIAPFPSASVWITNAFVKLQTSAKSKPTREPQQDRATTPRLATAPTSTAKPVLNIEAQEGRATPSRLAATDPTQSSVLSTQPSSPPPPTQHSALSTQHSPPSPKRTLLGAAADAKVGPAKIPASRLRQNVGQAASGAYSGTLTLVPHGNHPTKYRLVLFGADNKPQTICYVLGNLRQLDTLKNSAFTIEGAVYWFNGTELPTVFAQNIMRHKAP